MTPATSAEDQEFSKFRHPQTWVTKMETLSFTVIHKRRLADKMRIIVNVYRVIVKVAEGEGFEPPLPVKVNMISSHAHSTGLCHPSLGLRKAG